MCCPSDNTSLGQPLVAMLQGGPLPLGSTPKSTPSLPSRGSSFFHPSPSCSAPSAPDPTQSVVESRLPSSAYDCRAHLYKMWPGVQLAPGEALEWPLLLHTRTAGRLLLHSVWYCEPAVSVLALRSGYSRRVTSFAAGCQCLVAAQTCAKLNLGSSQRSDSSLVLKASRLSGLSSRLSVWPDFPACNHSTCSQGSKA